MGMCYWITQDVSQIHLSGSAKVHIRFDVAFYLVIGAGIGAVIATTLNLFQITCERREHHPVRRHDDMHLELMCADSSLDNIDHLPPIPIPSPAPPVYEP